jgi:hypothetical protein
MKLTSSAGVRVSRIPQLHAFMLCIGSSFNLPFWLLSITYLLRYNLQGIYGLFIGLLPYILF